MQWRAWQRIALGACRLRWLVAAAATLALAACTTDGQPTASISQPRGASVAFDSIDGPPQGQFYKLVANLNEEAQARRLAVVSRASAADYHARGYLAAKVMKREITISWVWDVFDKDQHRVLRIGGEEAGKGKHRDAWAAADDAMLHRIAHSSMDQLASFLTAPDDAVPATPATIASIGEESTPEAAGIFRIFRAHVDPVSGEGSDAAVAVPDATVPLPRRRPIRTAALPDGQTLSLAAAAR
jgi:hypothetical protein